MSAYARWRSLDRGERWLTVQSAAAVAAAMAALRLCGLARALRTAAVPIRGAGRSTVDVAAYADAVERAGRYIPGGTCLPRSLALTWLLRRRGVDAQLRFGVRKGTPFAAHAWVECGGQPVSPAADRQGAFTVVGGGQPLRTGR